jgi:2-amino-4-hydroxy-6-hydroxymethyldihydropteridine diphosphokinase
VTDPIPDPAPVEVWVSAGSNIEPERWLRMACRDLAARFGPLTLSGVYRNPALGMEGDDFLNLVIGFRTALPPEAVVAELERLHDLAGRVRSAGSWTPRTLDLDLLLYGDQVIDRPGVRVPRKDVVKYGFVLGPLAEAAPGLRHPVSGLTMAELWDRFDRDAAALTRIELDLLP